MVDQESIHLIICYLNIFKLLLPVLSGSLHSAPTPLHVGHVPVGKVERAGLRGRGCIDQRDRVPRVDIQSEEVTFTHRDLGVVTEAVEEVDY